MSEVLYLEVPYEDLKPNTWNPNSMSDEMFAKERASIREFGFIDPLTVRSMEHGSWYEIIDGEHRWKAGHLESIEMFPCIVIDVDDDEARELTIILNDTRGQMQEDRLAEVMQDLAERRESARMTEILPYSQERMDQLLDRREIDWSEMEKPPISRKRAGADEDPWVERVYRLPQSSAGVIDEAIAKVQEEDAVDQDWRALELIAADFLGK